MSKNRSVVVIEVGSKSGKRWVYYGPLSAWRLALAKARHRLVRTAVYSRRRTGPFKIVKALPPPPEVPRA